MFTNVFVHALCGGDRAGQLFFHFRGHIRPRFRVQPEDPVFIVRDGSLQFCRLFIVFCLLEDQVVIILCRRFGGLGRVAFLHGDEHFIILVGRQQLFRFSNILVCLFQVTFRHAQHVLPVGQQLRLVPGDRVLTHHGIQVIHVNALEGLQCFHPVRQGAARLPGPVCLDRIGLCVAVAVKVIQALPKLVQAVQHIQICRVNNGESIFRQLHVRVCPDQIVVIHRQDPVQQLLQFRILQLNLDPAVLIAETVRQGDHKPVLVFQLRCLQLPVSIRIPCFCKACQGFLCPLAFFCQDRTDRNIIPQHCRGDRLGQRHTIQCRLQHVGRSDLVQIKLHTVRRAQVRYRSKLRFRQCFLPLPDILRVFFHRRFIPERNHRRNRQRSLCELIKQQRRAYAQHQAQYQYPGKNALFQLHVMKHVAQVDRILFLAVHHQLDLPVITRRHHVQPVFVVIQHSFPHSLISILNQNHVFSNCF